MKRLTSICAVIIPVGLGFGLVHLFIEGRLSIEYAVAAILGLVALVGLMGFRSQPRD